MVLEMRKLKAMEGRTLLHCWVLNREFFVLAPLLNLRCSGQVLSFEQT